MGLKRLILHCAPVYWCDIEQRFIQNPRGAKTGLYIGTELEKDEIELISWATISGVEEWRISEGLLTPEESDRVNRAIEIEQDMRLFIEIESNYDTNYLQYQVERYKIEEEITMVVLDYIELTSALISEYTLQSKMAARGDSVLLNLSARLKDIARQYKVAFIAFTQVSENSRRDETIRDSGVIKDSKSLQNKADFACCVFEISTKELEKIQPILQAQQGFCPTPNVVYHVYKIRKGRFKQAKVFAFQDLGTMMVKDCFATNYRYEPINLDRVKIS